MCEFISAKVGLWLDWSRWRENRVKQTQCKYGEKESQNWEEEITLPDLVCCLGFFNLAEWRGRLFIRAALKESGKGSQFRSPDKVSQSLGGLQPQCFTYHILNIHFLTFYYHIVFSLPCHDIVINPTSVILLCVCIQSDSASHTVIVYLSDQNNLQHIQYPAHKADWCWRSKTWRQL